MPTLLSLFDGSGGFPLAGALCGITPKYASEVEPYPIAVTRSRFPDMIHLGDVSRVHGNEIDPVDVVTFGSPCQDMSIAGKRAGIKNENVGDAETTRSGLFHEAARIIREMREATNGVYPRFAVWENVPGAFSSNKGEDFRCVLETLIQIVEPGAAMPPVPKNGWPYADCYVGDGWSVAYRTFDAQYWGVPQRRRRIYLVLDLRGQRAGEILFKREGLRGYFAPGGETGERTSSDAAGGAGVCDRPVCIPINTMLATRWNALGRGTGLGIGEDGDPQFTISAAHEHAVCVPIILDDQGGQQITVREDGVSPTLRAEMHGHPPCVIQSAAFKAGQGVKARSIGWEEEKAPTLAAEAGGNSVPTVCVAYDARGNGDGKTASTITGDHESRITDYTTVVCIQGAVVGRSDKAGPMGRGYRMDGKAYTLDTKAPSVICMATQQGGAEIAENLCPTITAAAGMSGNNQPVICMQGNTIDRNAQQNGFGINEDVSFTLNAVDRHGVAFRQVKFGEYAESEIGTTIKSRDYKSATDLIVIRYIVRRLTPTECCRLQGFPDGWDSIDVKDMMPAEEDFFWLENRQTFDAINGRPIKDYTPKQILDWYNKLHSDGAKYKMWGNGIALPNALYVMEGIAEAMRHAEL